MKKFIHLRGSMAVGKTSAARQFVENGEFETKTIKAFGKDYPYQYDSKRNIVVTGRYDTRVCGGLDGVIKNRDIMLEYLLKIVNAINPDYIVFEAVMYGMSVKFAEELSAILKQKGFEYIGICLLPPLEVALERVYQRNGGKAIKEEQFVQKYGQSERSSMALKRKGYNIKIVDTSKIQQSEMWKIVQGEIN